MYDFLLDMLWGGANVAEIRPTPQEGAPPFFWINVAQEGEPRWRSLEAQVNRRKDTLSVYYGGAREKAFDLFKKNCDPFRRLRQRIQEAFSVKLTTGAVKVLEIFTILRPDPPTPTLVMCTANSNGSFFLGAEAFFKIHAPSALHKLCLLDLELVNEPPVVEADALFAQIDRVASRVSGVGGAPGADLFTSDTGVNCENFADQEVAHLPGFVRQTIWAFSLLKIGGDAIVKIYTFFRPLTLSLLAIYAHVFETFQIIKPKTSRQHNSEVYIAAKGFRGAPPGLLSYLCTILRSPDPYSGGLHILGGSCWKTLDDLHSVAAHFFFARQGGHIHYLDRLFIDKGGAPPPSNFYETAEKRWFSTHLPDGLPPLSSPNSSTTSSPL